MNLWRERAAVPTHALHFSFGVGALITPLIARPFLPKRRNDSSNGILLDANATISIRPLMDTNSTVPLYANSTRPDSTLDNTDRIEIAYAIMGSVTILCSLFFLFFQITSRKSADDREAVKRKPERSSSSDGGACTRLAARCKGIKSPTAILLAIIFMFWCLPTGAERAYSKFLFSYAVDGPLSMAPSTGTLLESVFWASFTAGRGVSTIASKWAPPHVLLAVEIVIKVICSFVLAFIANSNKIVLFVATGLFGATVSPIFPSVVVWTNLYVEMNAMMNSFAFLAGALGAMFFSWCAGYLFTYMGPPFLMYLMVGYALATLVVYIVMYSFLRFANLPKREKHVPPPTEQEIEHLTGDLTVSKPL